MNSNLTSSFTICLNVECNKLQRITSKSFFPNQIQLKKLLESDWLRAVRFKCNAGVKSATALGLIWANLVSSTGLIM